MTRTRIAAAAILTLGLLAPVAVASSASAAPPECGAAALAKDHKVSKANAKAKDAKAKAHGENSHHKPFFVHAGKVVGTPGDPIANEFSFVVRGGKVKAVRGCTITVIVTETTKINRNDAAALFSDLAASDHVNVKGTSAIVDGNVVYTATRIAADGAPAAG